MKKSTKIITTAVALVLVMGFMVVGIMAATTASASITASVNWTAEAGVVFELLSTEEGITREEFLKLMKNYMGTVVFRYVYRMK